MYEKRCGCDLEAAHLEARSVACIRRASPSLIASLFLAAAGFGGNTLGDLNLKVEEMLLFQLGCERHDVDQTNCLPGCSKPDEQGTDQGTRRPTWHTTRPLSISVAAATMSWPRPVAPATSWIAIPLT